MARFQSVFSDLSKHHLRSRRRHKTVLQRGANKRVSTTLTFRAGTGYLGDTILPDIFIAYDPEGYYAINPAISYAPLWNERIRFSLIGAIYGGRNKFKSFGFFSEKDSLFLKLRYQF